MSRDRKAQNKLDELVQTGKDLKAFEKDPEGRSLLKCYHYGVLDAFVVGRIHQRVERALQERKNLGNPFLPPELHRGNFVLGLDRRQQWLWTFMQVLNAHTLIVAGTGAGKTTLSKFHAIQIAPHVRGMWLVDLRKREYRALRPVFARLGIDLKIIRGRKFCINPLQVPMGVEPIEYAATAADLLVSVLNLPPRASTLLRTTIIKLYRANGVLAGGRRFPTMFCLFEAIRSDRSANAQARQAALDQLEAILTALGPDILGYHCGWDPHELARQHLAMELTGLPESGKDLVLGYLLTAEFMSRIARGLSNPRMDLWIAFDEAQRLLSQRQETAGYGGNALIDLLGLVRGTGVGLQISVLSTHDLSPNVPNLTGTKIFGRCGSVGEYTTVGRYMGLTSEQIAWCAHHMVPGLFVGQMADGNWRYPFVFRVPPLTPLPTGDPIDTPTDDGNVSAAVPRLPSVEWVIGRLEHGTTPDNGK
ncbi:hypothetical protein [Anaerobaca lacustris]|uniref:Uncharacterized protein n=1 Tax=Anaerobaca lacustris TaxID=3044600 RepID=A0AAW6TY95_9BACT|nr:hypothetical protein [Sedimentisphaerales bacterium M17dextr]